MKRIVVITSSPHKDGNSNKLAEAFIKGATSAGHQVSRFDASSKEINPASVAIIVFQKRIVPVYPRMTLTKRQPSLCNRIWWCSRRQSIGIPILRK